MRSEATAAAALVAILSGVAASAAPAQELVPAGRGRSLLDDFREPPDEARPRMYWRVFGPAWREDEIDYELAELKSAGVGGVMAYFLYPVALDDRERGVVNQRFLSPEFLATFRHAAEKARELGLRFSVEGGTGWPYGGPTVSAVDSAQKLSRRFVAPDWLRGGFAGATVEPDERLERAFLDGDEVTARARDGSLASTTGGPLELFVSGPTRMQVKRAAFGGEGLVVDPLARDAVGRWLDCNVAPLLDAAPKLVDSIGCDSLEVYGANWTAELPQEFERRRGYELLPMLPRLFDSRDRSGADLRFDFWRTIAELAEETCARSIGEWARARGVGYELEAYGTPPLPLTAARFVDVPTGEHYEWKAFSVQRLAASGAHLAGRERVGAEAWTWAGIPNRLADTLGDLKLLSDFHFLAGANDLTGVDFPYSPRCVGAPGWLPYYGPCFNPNHPQWPYFRALAEYVARCQLLLRMGRPVADVLLYLPVEDCFARGGVDQMLLDFALRDHFTTGRPTTEFGLANALVHHGDVVHGLLTHGFDFDGVDFWSLEGLLRAQDGALTNGSSRWRIVVLHDVERMSLASLERIAEFCRGGGTVIATKRLPERPAGLLARGEQARFDSSIREIFGEEIERESRDPALFTAHLCVEHACGRGRALFAADDASAFAQALASCDSDARVTPYEPEVSCVRRETDGLDIFFFVNAGARPASFTVEARVPLPIRKVDPTGLHAILERDVAVLLQPLTGGATRLPMQTVSAERVSFDVALPPRGSIFVLVLRGAWPDRSSRPDAAPAPTSRRALAGPWHVTFDGPDAPPPRDVAELRSWTEWPDARCFSGRATVSTSFDVDAPLPSRATLELPEVRDVAEIHVNGARAAILFTPPFECDVAPLLRAGRNRLEITVANLPLNRFLALPDADLAPLRAVYGNRFPAPEEKRLVKEPMPSGLIGTVELEITETSR